jgi:hypothetical protein
MVNEKTERAIDKMLGLKKYSATLWLEDEKFVRIAGSEKKIEMKAKNFRDAFHMGMEEYQEFKRFHKGSEGRCRGQMDKTEEGYKIEHGE